LDPLTRLSGDAQTFVEKVWARCIYVHRADATEFDDLLSLDDVDSLLTSSGLRTPMVRLAQDGSVLPSADYTRSTTVGGVAVTGLVDSRKLLDLFTGGATVILQGLHRYWLPLTRLVTDLEDALGHPCQANAYLTPAGSQGFARHSDRHDVFVFQTYGEKQWEIGDEDERQEVRMQPGMSMYLPTGTPHAARTQDGASLHVTVGINRVTWRSVLVRAVGRLLTDPELDEPLPAGYHQEPRAFAASLHIQLMQLRNLLSDADPNELATAETAYFLSSRTATLRGALLDRVDLAAIGDSTGLRRRPGARLTTVADRNHLRLLLDDRELQVPGHLAPALRHVDQHHQLTPADLAGWLDSESRLVLCRRLVREGLLEVVR